MLNSNFGSDNIYFSDDNDKLTNINEIAFVSIKSSSSNDSLQDLEIIEKKVHVIQTNNENNLINNECNCNSIIETTFADNSTQTDSLDNADLTSETELIALRIKHSNLESNFNTVSNLLKHFVTIDKENPKLDEIKMQLALIVNRELRQHHAFPFVSFMNKF